MSNIATIETERLCGHHDAAKFSCGIDELDFKLRDFQERFERGEKVLGFVVPDDRREVLGYIILSDTTLREPKSKRRIRCFTVPAMAITSDHKRHGLFEALIERALNALAVRQEIAAAGGAPYQGLVCMPGDNKVLERWLVGWAGFKRLSEGLYWIPLGDSDG
jgi:GNAT superfamily N-acetyltransferase